MVLVVGPGKYFLFPVDWGGMGGRVAITKGEDERGQEVTRSVFEKQSINESAIEAAKTEIDVSCLTGHQ